MNWHITRAAWFLGLTLGIAGSAQALPPKPQVTSPRLYVIDCGYITNDTPEIYQLSREEVSNTTMAVMCFLVVHPKGTFLFDTGLPDRFVGRPLGENPGSRKGILYLKINTLVGQLANLGYTPADIDFLSLSHSHWDHSGNANLFANTTTWLVARSEWDLMFGRPTPARGSEDFDGLKSAKTVFIGEDHDVFGDGSVVITQAFGHTPGHNVAQVRLANTGHIILAGDLYHYKEEMTLNRMPKNEEATQTPQSRAKVAALAKKANGQVWIAHDMELFLRLHKQPAWYD